MIEFDSRGREIPDSTPLEVPLGARRPESLTDMMRRLIRTEMSRQAVDDGNESFEEANDFDIPGDDFEENLTPYELHEMQEDAYVGRSQVPVGGAGGGPGEVHQPESDSGGPGGSEPSDSEPVVAGVVGEAHPEGGRADEPPGDGGKRGTRVAGDRGGQRPKGPKLKP